MRAVTMLLMKRSRRRRLVVLACVVLTLGIGRVVERVRTSDPLPAGGALTPARLDAAQMMADLRELASDRFEGRAPDSPGGRLAATFVAARFGALGLGAYGGGFEQPFTFEHRSIRALWRRDRPFVKAFREPRNVIAYVAGRSRPEEVIVVSAHFDHLGVRDQQVYPGADDNASGTAALLAIAAYTARHQPERTIVFAAFDAEELGLRGSAAFLRALPFRREQLRLDLNIDMIGRSDGGRLYITGTRHYPRLVPLALAGARGAQVPVHLGHDRPFYLSGLTADWTSASDHGSFHDVGVPFLYFGVEDHADVHAPTDTADRIEPRFLAASAEVVLSTLLAADSASATD